MKRPRSRQAEPVRADLGGRVCIVTGATAGIGKEIARQLAALGATVVIAGRNLARTEAAAEEIARDTGNEAVETAHLDLASQDSIRGFAGEVVERFGRVEVLANNAAVWQPQRHLSADGIELTWAVNVLGPHLLTGLLADVLRKGQDARIVNVASRLAGGLDLSDVEFRRRRYNGIAAYRQSKQALRMLSWTWAERLEADGVTVGAAHPGFTRSDIARDVGGWQGTVVRAFFGRCGQSPQCGADTPLWLAASSQAQGQSGRFWVKRREWSCPYRDPAAREQLWEILCRQSHISTTC
ncbi:MAG: SDR family oxidoreductase [Armatimonadetes bacterium]|nr:SDR family oxidoreductase [Armatimonadota bacterium]